MTHPHPYMTENVDAATLAMMNYSPRPHTQPTGDPGINTMNAAMANIAEQSQRNLATRDQQLGSPIVARGTPGTDAIPAEAAEVLAHQLGTSKLPKLRPKTAPTAGGVIEDIIGGMVGGVIGDILGGIPSAEEIGKKTLDDLLKEQAEKEFDRLNPDLPKRPTPKPRTGVAPGGSKPPKVPRGSARPDPPRRRTPPKTGVRKVRRCLLVARKKAKSDCDVKVFQPPKPAPEGPDIFGPRRTGPAPKPKKPKPKKPTVKVGKVPVPGHPDLRFIWNGRFWNCWSAKTRRFVKCPKGVKKPAKLR